MSLFSKKRQTVHEEIPSTPLLDVMFNLLIFVLVTAQYTNVQALKVNLPNAKTGASIETKTERTVITITKEEEIFLDGEAIDKTRLESALASLKKKEPSVLIQADAHSTTGLIVTVMDIASKVGLKKIAIETRK